MPDVRRSLTELQIRLLQFVRAVARRTAGASAVEYGLLIGLIAIGIILAVGALGVNLSDRFSQIATGIANS